MEIRFFFSLGAFINNIIIAIIVGKYLMKFLITYWVIRNLLGSATTIIEKHLLKCHSSYRFLSYMIPAVVNSSCIPTKTVQHTLSYFLHIFSVDFRPSFNSPLEEMRNSETLLFEGKDCLELAVKLMICGVPVLFCLCSQRIN